MKPKRLFLTGATGFIGSNLLEKFVKEGYEIVALVRPSSNLRFIQEYIDNNQIEIREGDIKNRRGLIGLMEGCDTLIHCASFVGDWGRRKDYYETNVQGTINILETGKEQGIDFTILVSSNAVLGEEDCLRAKREDDVYNPIFPYFLRSIFESDMNHYRNTKALSEKEAIDFSLRNKSNLKVVRPVWTYGPREFNAGPYIFCKSVLLGNRFFPGSRTNKFHTIYVEDLSEMILRLTEKRKRGINIFNTGSQKITTLDEFWKTFCNILGEKPPIYLPKNIVYPLGFGMEALYKTFKSKEAPLLTRARVEMGYCNNIYDVKKIHEEVGPIEETPLRIGVEKTVKWWRKNGYL
ncbi:MAG: NAD-dependent epimerase/dehydratase family protein [Nanoarchaeota archaeon]|nr:NAD-dependent epimerase/dehydratase family protein [Nanoarchaeota archaeon]